MEGLGIFEEDTVCVWVVREQTVGHLTRSDQ